MTELLSALTDSEAGCPILGKSWFEEAKFTGETSFSGARFSGDAIFSGATFSDYVAFWDVTFDNVADFSHTSINGIRFGRSIFSTEANFFASKISEAWFVGAQFLKGVDFTEATFIGNAGFVGASFAGMTMFNSVHFNGEALFHRASFLGHTEFVDVTFNQQAVFDDANFTQYSHFSNASFAREARFNGATFTEGVRFEYASFLGTQSLGPLLCRGDLAFDWATFSGPATIEAVAFNLSCKGTKWESTATLRLRHVVVDLTDAVLTQPFAVTAHPGPFRYRSLTPLPNESERNLDESTVDWNTGVSLCSLRGVDCAMVSLADIDLTKCRFVGAFHLDQLRLEGQWSLRTPPHTRVWRLGFPFRWTQRQVVEEERQWRALPSRQAPLREGWGNPPQNQHEVPGLATLTIIYRQLRKAREDAKDEPGAADFYYGEMEMRRHGRKRSQAERWLLHAYWLLSGYGLRASRALGWLALAMTTTILLMMGFGLPQDSPKQAATGTVPPGGGRVTFKMDKEDPRNPTRDRFTGERFDKALSVTLNSVVFRSSGQDLTTAGGYIEMASRFSEPVLLGLAALAIRGRVKR
ncbi:pentapeptide repeat-containing protein [Streptomyces scopuliridis]|uniref:pentapeptide repeat-containing protein n=1 Tax=Streptomyces scopuliridis TaxID=452529 RepID=UPI00369DEA96